MPPMFPARSALRIALAIAVASACAPFATAARAADAAPPDHQIKDPQYGDALFQFFQDRYFTSITTLMASQKFERVEHHADEAEVLRGGMLASYGLTREAGEIFSHLIERGATPAVRDRAWFYLAKIRYQRGYLPEAEAAIARVENHLPPDLEEERALLLANLLMARQDYAGAASALNPLVTKSFLLRKTVGSYYARYNLVVFDDMLATRRKAYADRLPQIRERREQISVDALSKRRDAIAADIARGELEADGVVFADDKQLALLERLRAVRKMVDDPVATADMTAQRLSLIHISEPTRRT